MISLEDMKKLEDLSEQHGVSKIKLMENAGHALFDELIKKYGLEYKKILIVCGHGNNGGDGLVLARYLHQAKFDVKVLFIGREENLKKESGYNYFLLKQKNPEIFSDSVELINGSDLIIDAMLGTGVSGDLTEPYDSIVDLINNSGKTIVSVDIPTGTINPEIIYTMYDLKEGMERFRDKIVIIDIGIPEAAIKAFSAK